MATDAKKHTTLGASETPSRAALAAALLSINDVIPVANRTEANQVASAVAAGGQNLATNPVVVARANARGLHRIEYTYDGTTWLPASGVLDFASKADADTFASANSSLLSIGDECWVGSANYAWDGAAWRGGAETGVTFAGIYSSSGASPVSIIPRGGIAYANGIAVSSSATFTPGTNYNLGTIPAALAPAEDQRYIVSAGPNNSAFLVVKSDGGLIFAVLASFTGVLAMGLASVKWFIGN